MVSFGISTWSVHRSIASGAVNLPDLAEQLRAHGLTDLQICHFHLPSRTPADLDALRARIESNGVTLDALLLDFGDLSHHEHADRDATELAAWLPTAARLGARFVRIAAGSQTPTEETLKRSAQHLLRLADAGEKLGVKVITENWHPLVPSSVEALRLRGLTQSRVPLCFDFGNWTGPTKYDELEKIAPYAVTVHAKCSFDESGTADATDFRRCFETLRRANFDGTIALIYDSAPTDEWRYIDEELKLAREALNA